MSEKIDKKTVKDAAINAAKDIHGDPDTKIIDSMIEKAMEKAKDTEDAIQIVINMMRSDEAIGGCWPENKKLSSTKYDNIYENMQKDIKEKPEEKPEDLIKEGTILKLIREDDLNKIKELAIKHGLGDELKSLNITIRSIV